MRVRSISLLTLIALLAGTPVAAQDRTATTSPTRTTTTSTPTAEDAARTMFLSGMRGAQAAPQLQADFRLSARSIPAAMRAGGYGTTAIVSGLVTGLRAAPAEVAGWMLADRVPVGETAVGLRDAGVTEATVGKVLAEGGYAVLETREALVRAGIESDPEFQRPAACMTWEGQVVCPGSGSGGSTWGQAMGAVTVSPSGAGETGSTLTMESTNIPEVEVRIGSVPLQLLEATASRIRAVLPASPMTGDLVMVRQADGKVGTIVSGYEVVAPPVQSSPAEWTAWSEAAREAAALQVRLWLLQAGIRSDRCVVSGVSAIGSAGAFGSGHDIASGLRSTLQAAGAPYEIADAWSRGFDAAWHGWADRVSIPGLPWYPAFAAWPGPQAPPTASVPTPLVSLVSAGLGEMTSAAIRQRIEDEIGDPAKSSAAASAIQAFADDMGTRFALYVATSQIVSVMGQGTVPSYDPDKGVVVGPVLGGSCEGGTLTGTF